MNTSNKAENGLKAEIEWRIVVKKNPPLTQCSRFIAQTQGRTIKSKKHTSPETLTPNLFIWILKKSNNYEF